MSSNELAGAPGRHQAAPRLVAEIDDRVLAGSGTMVVPSTAPHSAWPRHWMTLAVAVTALTAMFWPTAASIARSWAGDPLGHGYIIAPAVIYLAWNRRELLKASSPAAEWRAIPLTALFAASWFFARLAGAG